MSSHSKDDELNSSDSKAVNTTTAKNESLDSVIAKSSSATNIKGDEISNDDTYAKGLPDDSIIPPLTTNSNQSSTDSELEPPHSSGFESIQTPSISMSAGADPWADPPAFTPHESELRKPSRDNPWATGSPVPELADDISTSNQTGENNLTDTNNLRTSVLLQNATQNETYPTSSSTNEQVKYTLVKDEREGDYDLPRLGKPAARYWPSKPGHLNLNNGGYGACPQPVVEYVKTLLDQQEETPDHWRYNVMGKLLDECREGVAKIVNADKDDVVLIQNATTGTNVVLRDLIFKQNDAILILSTSYPAVKKTVEYIQENEKFRGNEISLIICNLSFPATQDEILKTFRQSIEEGKKQGKNIRIGIIDTINSRPGVRLPWAEMVKILRENQILSLVDGAHGIGAIPIDLKKVDPDFFASNCHKWLYAHRSNAFLYVPKRNRHLQRSGMPTSFAFIPDANSENNTWADQWAGAGTEDMSCRLSIKAAIQFREHLGGEARILNYNHDLAIRGGEAAAKILGTSCMDTEDHSMTASMANVRLPIISSRIAGGNGNDPVALDSWTAKAGDWFFHALHTEFKTCIPIYPHNGKVWARLSAQVWLDIDDFKYGARALLELCRRINEGQAPDFN